MSRVQRGEGYVLLGIAIGLVIMGIFMGAAVPVWQHVMQREREEELVWRGMQYAQAIERYQRKYPGAFPPNVEILVQQKFLRKRYKDPMTEDGEFRLIRQMSPEYLALTRPGVPPEQGPAGTGPGTRRRSASSARGGQGTTGSPGRAGASTRPSSSSFASSRSGGEEALGGIVGVASKSKEESIRIYNGKESYDQWLFVYLPQTSPRGRPGVGIPGQPGSPAGVGRPGGRRPGPNRPGMGSGQRNRPPSGGGAGRQGGGSGNRPPQRNRPQGGGPP